MQSIPTCKPVKGSGRDIARVYTKVYGVGVAIAPPESIIAAELQKLGWEVVIAESLSDVWREACSRDDPVIVADGDLAGFPRKCHILSEVHNDRISSPFAQMSCAGGYVLTRYPNYLRELELGDHSIL